MRKTITLLFAIFLALGISAQNFGVGLDYMMLSGTMVKDAEGNAVTYVPEGETAAVDASSSSAVLNVSYTHPLSEKLDMVGSVGYGMGFGLIPLKASLSYGIASNISANLGVGMYMITDDSYDPQEITIGENEWKGSSNEFGINLGVNYQMNNIYQASRKAVDATGNPSLIDDMVVKFLKGGEEVVNKGRIIWKGFPNPDALMKSLGKLGAKSDDVAEVRDAANNALDALEAGSKPPKVFEPDPILIKGFETRALSAKALAKARKKGLIDTERMISGNYPLDQFVEAMDDLRDHPDEHVKVVISP